MKYLATLTAILFLALTGSAWAQFKISTLLDQGPIHLSAGLDIQFTKFGQYASVSATTFAALRNAQAIVDSIIPGFNQKLGCRSGRSFGVAITAIELGSNAAFNQSTPLNVTANAHFATCGLSVIEGDVAASYTIEPVVVRSSVVQLRVEQSSVRSLGVSVVGFIPVPNRLVADAAQQIAPTIQRYATTINQLLRRQLLNSSLQQQIKTYKLRIQSAQLSFSGVDLVVTINLTGQVSLSYLDSLVMF